VVVDTSILLAILFNENHGPWAADQLYESDSPLVMSTVNYTEALILVHDRQPNLAEAIREMIEHSSIRLVPPDSQQAEVAARARLRFPINLGDCFAYALAVAERCPVLTLDGDFRKCDIDVVYPLTTAS
jgi:ribonuclease VapC